MINETILLVDDEERVLSSLTRELFEEDICEIRTAQSGTEALEIIKDIKNLAVIISDYHMPGMNGIDFLSLARKISPDTTRMILTGAGDLEVAVEAINRGNIFRFLLKPCPSDQFITSVKDGITQFHLVTGEKILLSKTLNGSIKVMIDILAALDPDVFAQATRLRALARELTIALQLDDQTWKIELAALLCRIGAVTIPREIYNKWKMGVSLDDFEQKLINSIPKVSQQLINNIPRLEDIAEAVGCQECIYRGRTNIGSPTGENIPQIGRILKIIVDYDRLQDNVYNSSAAYQAMLQHESDYDPKMLDIFREKVLGIGKSTSAKPIRPKFSEKEIAIEELRTGMVLARNVMDRKGRLIVSRGTVITDILKIRLLNYYHTRSVLSPIVIESTL